MFGSPLFRWRERQRIESNIAINLAQAKDAINGRQNIFRAKFVQLFVSPLLSCFFDIVREVRSVLPYQHLLSQAGNRLVVSELVAAIIGFG